MSEWILIGLVSVGGGLLGGAIALGVIWIVSGALDRIDRRTEEESR